MTVKVYIECFLRNRQPTHGSITNAMHHLTEIGAFEPRVRISKWVSYYVRITSKELLAFA